MKGLGKAECGSGTGARSISGDVSGARRFEGKGVDKPVTALSSPMLRAAMDEVITTLSTDGDFAAERRRPRVP